MGNELVSIGMPVYNGEKSIRQALLSAIQQTYKNIEILISDNSSSDSTYSLCEEIISEYPEANIKCVRQDRNIGPIKNFEYVLSEAKGQYFMWLAHDDQLSANYIEACVDEFLIGDGLAIVGGQPLYKVAPGVRQHAVSYIQKNPCLRVEAYLREVSDNSIFYGLIKRSYVSKLEIRNCLATDWIIVMGLLFQGPGRTIPEATIMRGVEGASKDIKNILEVLDLPGVIGKMPYLNIASSVFKAVAIEGAVYRDLGYIKRHVWGFKLFCLVIARHIHDHFFKVWLHLMLTRLKRIFITSGQQT